MNWTCREVGLVENVVKMGINNGLFSAIHRLVQVGCMSNSQPTQSDQVENFQNMQSTLKGIWLVGSSYCWTVVGFG